MTIKIKTIKGRQYGYDDVSYRVFGKVKTKSVDLGTLISRRRKRDGPGLLIGGLVVPGVAAAKGGLKRPRQKAQRTENPRDINKAHEAVRKLDFEFGVDRTSVESWHNTRTRLSPERLQEHGLRELGAWRSYHADQVARQKAAAPAAKRKVEGHARAVPGWGGCCIRTPTG